jgi:DNA-binding response OmpR family regulator
MMSELPELEGQIRVLVIEDDLITVRQILVRCTEAGMDTRYAPPGPPALEAIRTIRPHVVLLGICEPEDGCLRLALRIKQETSAPLLVLTDKHTSFALWQEVFPDASKFIARDTAPQAILQRITARIRDTYHEKQLMVAEAPIDAPTVPKGWGTCQGCGYIGPRAKFVNPNPLARHAVTCPACKHCDDIVFAVA